MSDHLKYDDAKPPMQLLPRAALEAEARVLGFGARKYAPHGWREGMAWSRLLGAAMRHITAFMDGENNDPESGISHLAHARCCLGFLLEYQDTHPEHDDRYRRQNDPTRTHPD